MIVAIILIVLAVGVAVAVWYRRKGSTKSNTHSGGAFDNPLYDMSSASAERNQPSSTNEDSSGYMDVQPAGTNEDNDGYMDMPAGALCALV